MARHRRRTALTVLAALAAAFVSGCGSMGNHMQRIPVTSAPAGAAVSVDGKPRGTTPVMVWLPRKGRSHIVRIECPGYDPVELRTEREFSGSYLLGNALLGAALSLPIAMAESITRHDDHFFLYAFGFGGLFALIDFAQGTGHVLRPRELQVTLMKAAGEPRIRTMVLDADEMRNIMWIRVRRDR